MHTCGYAPDSPRVLHRLEHDATLCGLPITTEWRHVLVKHHAHPTFDWCPVCSAERN